MKTMITFLCAIAGGVWSQVVFFGLPRTGHGWLWFVSTTLIVAAAVALFMGRTKAKDL